MNLFSLEIVYLFPEVIAVSLSEYSVIKRGNFNGNRSVPSNFMWDIEYSVITSDVLKSFDCIWNILNHLFYNHILKCYSNKINTTMHQSFATTPPPHTGIIPFF